MELYLFRHGIAEDAPPGRADSSRALTDAGRERSAAVVKMAREAAVTPSLIASSPYLRAVQTAEVAAKEFGYAGDLVRLPSLVPHGTPDAVWSDIRDLRDEAAVLLAGHEPLMGHLAAYLLNAPSLMVDMKKSAMLRIDVATLGTAPRGVLQWMIVPKLARY
jgi:phosphohistidine phosphatase